MGPWAPAVAILLAGAAVQLAHASPVALEATEVEIVHAKSDRDDRMTVPVNIGGQGPFRFLIDTGSQKTVLAKDVATALSLESGPNLRIVGIAGAEIVETAHVEEIGLGRRSFHGLVAPLLEGHHIGADGIVGLDSLQGQRVLLDFTRNVIAIGDARGLGGNSGYEIVVTARRRSGQLIMTDAQIEGIRTDVIIDTGSGTSIGNRALQRALRHRGDTYQTKLVSVTGQETIADIGFARQLTISEIGITNLVIAFADAPTFAVLELERRPAIMLGMRELRLFRRIAIDFHTRKVMFDIPEDL